MIEPTPLWQTRRFRIGVLVAAIAVLALVLILQNFDTTEVQFYFWRAEAPLAVVIFTSMLAGAGLQMLIKTMLRRRKRVRQAGREPANPGGIADEAP